MDNFFTEAEIQSGLNLLLAVAAATAFVMWFRYARDMSHSALKYQEGSDAHRRAMTSRNTMWAVALSMAAGAVLALSLVPYYVGKAADMPWLMAMSRDEGLVSIANIAKGVMGIAAFLHVRGWLAMRFGRRWPLALIVITFAIFSLGAFGPRFL